MNYIGEPGCKNAKLMARMGLVLGAGMATLLLVASAVRTARRS